MDKNYVERIKLDEKGNIIRDEENLWTIIDILIEGASISSDAIVGLQQLSIALSKNVSAVYKFFKLPQMPE